MTPWMGLIYDTLYKTKEYKTTAAAIKGRAFIQYFIFFFFFILYIITERSSLKADPKIPTNNLSKVVPASCAHCRNLLRRCAAREPFVAHRQSLLKTNQQYKHIPILSPPTN